jgi:hypothetical protein
MKWENLPSRLETELFRLWYRLSGARPSSAPYVSGDSFRALADVIIEPGRDVAPAGIARGAVVFVQASEVGRFVEKILPGIGQPFVLITHNGDVNIDERFLSVLEDGRVCRWFAQNALISHPKLTAIPIGLENRFYHSNGVIRDFKRLSRRRSDKANRILHAFTVETNPRERVPALEALRCFGLADAMARTNGRRYRETLERYAFVASPPGNGVDCHRTWEALYLGVVPVVKRSALYEAFPGLPVLALDDWNEMLEWDERFLLEARARLVPGMAASPHLRMDHWAGLIGTEKRRLSCQD